MAESKKTGFDFDKKPQTLHELIIAADLLQEQIRLDKERKSFRGRTQAVTDANATQTKELSVKDRKRNIDSDHSKGQNQIATTSSSSKQEQAFVAPTATTSNFASYRAATEAFKNLSTGPKKPRKKRSKMEASSSNRMRKSSSTSSMQSSSSDVSSTSSNPVIDLEADLADDSVHVIPNPTRPEPIVVDLTEEPSFSDDDVIVMESPRPYQPNNIFQGVHGVKAEIPDPVSSEKLAENQKNQGNDYFRSGEYKEAMNKYNEAIRLNSKEALYFSNRAACHYKMNNFNEALSDAKTCISMDKTLARGHERALRAALALGDVVMCELILNEANSVQLGAEAEKDKTNLQFLRTHLASKLNHDSKDQFRESLYYTDKAIEIAIGNPCLRMSKVELLFRLGRQEEAVEYYQLSKKTSMGTAESFYILALCHYYQDNLASALPSCQQALNLDPDKVKYVKLFKKLKALHEVREEGKKKYADKTLVKESYDLFIKCLELLKDLETLLTSKNVIIESKVLCNLSRLSNKLKSWDEAVSHATKAIEVNPKHFKSFAVRASLYREKDMFEEAVRDYEAFLKSEPRNKDIKEELHKTKIALAQSKKKDYYKILGVTRNATDDEVKKAYKTLAKVHHPDRHSNATPTEQKKQEKLFKDLGQAYSILSDPGKRRKYDMGGYDENSPGDGFSSAAGFNAGFDPTMFFSAFMGPQGFQQAGDFRGFQGAGTSRRFYQQ